MDEQQKREMAEATSTEQTPAAPQEKKENSAGTAQREDRSRFFRLLAGAYLLYLAYQLISGAVRETGWTTMRIVGLCAGVLFAGFGIWLLAVNGTAMLKNVKGTTAAENTKDPQDPDKGEIK